jgi:hypothetical protein
MKYSSDSELLSKKFRPSKTAQNSLNFISTNDEAILRNMELCDDTYDIVKMIYLLLGYKPESKEISLKKLYDEIMPSLGVNNLSNML